MVRLKDFSIDASVNSVDDLDLFPFSIVAKQGLLLLARLKTGVLHCHEQNLSRFNHSSLVVVILHPLAFLRQANQIISWFNPLRLAVEYVDARKALSSYIFYILAEYDYFIVANRAES